MKFLFIFCILIFFYNKIFANCSKAKDSSRIVVAGGSITETLFYLDLSKNIIAVDTTSNFPDEAKNLPSIGYVRALSTEGVLSLNPTLIIGEKDMGPPNVIQQIRNTSVELKIIEEDNSAEGINKKIDCIKNIVGGKKFDSEKNINLKSSILKLKNISNINNNNKIRGLIILMMRGTSPIVAGSDTSGGDFLRMIGATNSMNSFEGWKPVGREAIMISNPDFIIVTKRALKNFGSSKTFMKESGILDTKAAKLNKVFFEDGMQFLGFGPRTMDLAIKIAKDINEQPN